MAAKYIIHLEFLKRLTSNMQNVKVYHLFYKFKHDNLFRSFITIKKINFSMKFGYNNHVLVNAAKILILYDIHLLKVA